MDDKKLLEADRISELFYKRITKQITLEEAEELEEWIKQSDYRRKKAEELSDVFFLREEYHLRQSIDAYHSFQRFRQRLKDRKSRTMYLAPLWRMAASLLFLLAIGGLFWYREYIEVVPPVIPTEIQTAMRQSQEMGKQQANVTFASPEEKEARRTVVQTLKQSFQISNEEQIKQLLEAKRITTRQDKEYWLTLSDGTLVHLNYNSSLIYPEHFVGDNRIVVLEGEAYFMVAKDRRRPFVVHTANGDIKEYGTEFNINTRAANGTTEVVLVEGSISVIGKNQEEHIMQPGQIATVKSDDCQLSTVDVTPYVAWNSGFFCFEDCRLDRLMSVLTRWYGYKVVFEHPILGETTFTGRFDKYDKMENQLNAIRMVTGLNIKIQENTIIITR